MTMMKSWMTMIFHSKYLGRRKEAYEKNKNLQKNAGKISLTINKFFIIISHNYKKSITIIGIKNK